MNILFLVGKYPSYGGTEKVTTILANEFSKRGKVFIASFEQPNPELKTELNDGIDLVHLSYPIFSKKNILILANIIKNSKVDIIINQWCLNFNTTSLSKLAIRNTNCKLIAVHHNAPDKNARITDLLIQLSQNKRNLLKKILLNIKLIFMQKATGLSLRYVYSKSDNYIVLSNSFRKNFTDITGIKNLNKLNVITNPLTIKDSNLTHNQGCKEKTLLYVGRIDFNQKRVIRIIEIWEVLSQKFPDWKLKIVGDGPEKKNLESLAIKRNIERLSFEGFSSPIKYYKEASLLILTSEYEGFPLVIAESMRYSVVPVVLGSYSAVYDIIDNNKNGIIIPSPYNKTDFCSRLNKLMKNPEQRDSYSNEALIKSELYTIENIIPIWDSLFKNLHTK